MIQIYANVYNHISLKFSEFFRKLQGRFLSQELLKIRYNNKNIDFYELLFRQLPKPPGISE